MHYNSHNRACDWPMPTQKATQFEIYNTLLKSFEGTSIFFFNDDTRIQFVSIIFL